MTTLLDFHCCMDTKAKFYLHCQSDINNCFSDIDPLKYPLKYIKPNNKCF